MKLEEVEQLLGKHYKKFSMLCQKFGQALDEDWSDRKYKAVTKELSKLMVLIKEKLLEKYDEDDAEDFLNQATFFFGSQKTYAPLQDLASAIKIKGKGF